MLKPRGLFNSGRKVALLVVAALLVSGVAAFAIVGGKQAEKSKWPWIAQVHRDGAFNCGGSLVAANFALTAAHCIYGEGREPPSDQNVVVSSDRMEVFVGRHERQSGGEAADVLNVIPHPAYDGTGAYDIALLELSRRIGADPVPLADASSAASWSDGAELDLAGWGSTEKLLGDNEEELSEQARKHLAAGLQHGRPTIKGTDFCESHVDETFSSGTELCSHGGEGTPCLGDSGGPLFSASEPAVVAVVSGGPGNCRETVFGVLRRASIYALVADGELRDWITGQLAASVAGESRCPDFQFEGIFVAVQVVDLRTNIDCATAEAIAREVLSRDDCVEETESGTNDCTAQDFDCQSELHPRDGITFGVECQSGTKRVSFSQEESTVTRPPAGPLTATSIGPAEIGMTQSEVQAVFGQPDRTSAGRRIWLWDYPNPGWINTEDLTGVALNFKDGELYGYACTIPECVTAEGLRAGDSPDRLREIYGSALVPHPDNAEFEQIVSAGTPGTFPALAFSGVGADHIFINGGYSPYQSGQPSGVIPDD